MGKQQIAGRVTSSSYGVGPEPTLSVVVATHRRAEFLPTLVESLEAQVLDGQAFEVVLVDDCSPDETWDTLLAAVKTTALQLLCLRLGENVGSGGARSVGLGHSRAPVVAFTDDDCLPVPTWLRSLSAPFGPLARNATHTVVQGRTVPWPEDAADAGPWARTLWILRATWLFETCNIAYRRADLDAVGGFPSRAETPPVPSGRQVGEDALAGWKVIDGGAQLVFEPAALVHHRNAPATYLDWVRDQRGRAVFPALVAHSPHARRALWGRWFLAPRSAAAALAALSVVAATLSRRAGFSVGVVPWAVLALPEARSRGGVHPAVRLAQLALVDLAGLVATVEGSIRNRSLVL